MMLLTTCPACSAQFRVLSAQLNVRQGRVMCGRCRQVFNAFETLRRVEEDDRVVAVDLEQGVETHPADPQPSPVAIDGSRGFIPVQWPRETEAAKPYDALPAAGELAVTAPPNVIHATPTPVTDTTATVERDEVVTVPATPGVAPPRHEYVIDVDNPLMGGTAAKRSGAQSRAWPWLAMLSFLVLVAQCLYLFRGDIIDRYPSLRPQFAAACDVLGCALTWKRDASSIEIVDSSLLELPGRPGRILLTATMVNRSQSTQDYPVLKLDLNDNSNQPLIRRLLAPAEYIGRPLLRDDGLAASAELYVNLSLDVGPTLRATGYGLNPLYP